jgi:hypothetical protein
MKTDFIEEDNDFEEWEGDANLIDDENWVGLLELRKQRAQKRPLDLYAQQGFADALVINKKYAEAIEFLKPLYSKHYESGFGIHEILDALYGLGKTEDDFNWIIKPNIFKLDKELINKCIVFLKGKRKHVSAITIFGDLIMHADYLTFNEEELSEFLLKNDNTFDFIGDKKYYFDMEFKLKRP